MAKCSSTAGLCASQQVHSYLAYENVNIHEIKVSARPIAAELLFKAYVGSKEYGLYLYLCIKGDSAPVLRIFHHAKL